MTNEQQSGTSLRWWLVGYLGLAAIVLSLMLYARHSAVAQLSSPQSIAEWQQWRDDVRDTQSKPKTVERRVPKSEEPPELVLMRDYFGIMLFGALLFSSLLYAIMVWFIVGMMSGNRVRENSDQN